MNCVEAKLELQQLLNKVSPSEVRKLLDWIKNSELDHLLLDNNKVILQNIADDLRARLPPDAMLPSETAAHHKSQMQQRARPTVHVDSFLYSDEQMDTLCEEGAMSRNYCLSCGSFRTAPLFISHSFSATELQFLFQNLLPDLSGRTLVDVGSRLGAVLYGGYVYSSASRLLGLELNEDFVRLQNDIVHKYKFSDRVQVLHADVCTQEVLLNSTDVLIMNNVFEYFMESSEQVWVEELPVDYDVYLGKDTDPEALRQIHLYRIL
uniref:Zgc:109986 n=1 Tax=Kryptolebias marmoratus TaxID=37003 RepID=A0A3Q3BM65_KRYMA